jgi:ribonuclease Z
MVEVTFLGTAGSTFYGEKFTPSILVGSVLLDCPSPCPYTLSRLGLLDKIELILLTHVHPDHSLGVIELLWHLWIEGRGRKLQIVGPVGTEKFFESILEVIHPARYREILSHSIFREVEPPARIGNISLYEARHTVRALGVRLDYGSASLCYSGDTSPSSDLASGFRDCTLLVHEATYPPGMEREAVKDGHSTPIQAAIFAKEINACYLALIHLPYARLGPGIDETYLEAARKIFRNVFIPRPMDKIIIEGGKIWKLG